MSFVKQFQVKRKTQINFSSCLYQILRQLVVCDSLQRFFCVMLRKMNKTVFAIKATAGIVKI